VEFLMCIATRNVFFRSAVSRGFLPLGAIALIAPGCTQIDEGATQLRFVAPAESTQELVAPGYLVGAFASAVTSSRARSAGKTEAQRQARRFGELKPFIAAIEQPDAPKIDSKSKNPAVVHVQASADSNPPHWIDWTQLRAIIDGQKDNSKTKQSATQEELLGNMAT
jgi:hypothetical protein